MNMIHVSREKIEYFHNLWNQILLLIYLLKLFYLNYRCKFNNVKIR